MNGRVSGNIVDLETGRIYPGAIVVENERIARIEEMRGGAGSRFLVPGFVDAHVHIESSLLVPSEFARIAVLHGTVATVSDPHEIANVVGSAGVDFMIANGRRTPFRFFFGAPSCVPATDQETAGATLGPAEVERLLARDEIGYLSEMMNFPGVLNGDPGVLAKIAAANRFGKPVDGHAPGLRGKAIARYAAAGISTDHESFSIDEAREKLAVGMKIAIREGSAARNFDELAPLLKTDPSSCFFCSDDKHCDSLLAGHIDNLVRRALRLGCDPISVLRVASLNPVRHYRLDVGLLQVNDRADFIEISEIGPEMRVLRTWIDGELVARSGESLVPRTPVEIINRFAAQPKRPEDFAVRAEGDTLRVIEAIEGQLITRELREKPTIRDGMAIADPRRDLLKLAVVNRYADSPPAVAFIRNFGLNRGAIASSVAHDSHNVIAVGADDFSLAVAINLVIESRGGLAVADGENAREALPLPVAGLMSDRDGFEVARDYLALDRAAKSLGASLAAPFMTLSFMALLVIPALKLSDKGLFDGTRFKIVPLWVQ